MNCKDLQTSGIAPQRPLPELVEEINSRCNGAGLCARHCDFLKKHGVPGQVAKAVAQGDVDPALAFECSLCGLCTAVCPQGLDPKAMFLALRQQAVAQGRADLVPYKRLLAYEAVGASPRFSFYHLPPGCRTVLFPGCNLPGSRPKAVEWLMRCLSAAEPHLGLVLDCCHKPSHDLGRREYFGEMFGPLRRFLTGQGVERVLVACPNCHAVFAEHAPELALETVYEVLAGMPDAGAEAAPAWGAVMHDPCAVRGEAHLHQAARRLACGKGVDCSAEMPHHGSRTICCGEGGAVAAVAPDLARAWTAMRHAEAAGRPMITYCAGCSGTLSRGGRVPHLLDLLMDPAAALEGRSKVHGWPFNYLQRLLLKRRLAKSAGRGRVGSRPYAK